MVNPRDIAGNVEKKQKTTQQQSSKIQIAAHVSFFFFLQNMSFPF